MEPSVLNLSTTLIDEASRVVPTQDLYLRLLTGRDAIPQVKKAWEQITANWHDRQFFHLYPWHKSYIEAMGGERDAVFVLIYHRYRPIGVIPLRREQRALHRLSLRVLTVPLHPQMPLSDLIFHGSIVDSEFPAALIAVLRLHQIEWDLLEVKNVAAHSTAFALLRPGRPLCHAVPSQCCDYIPSIANYRDKARRAKKRLLRAGEFAFAEITDPKELHKGFDRYLNANLCEWRTPPNPDTAGVNATFFRRLIDNFGPSRGCHLHLLHVDDAVVAALFGLVVDRRAYALRLNTDPEYDRYAPAWILQDHWIRHHLREGRTVYLLTDKKYRAGLDPLRSNLFDVRLYNNTGSGWAAFGLAHTRQLLRR